MFLQSTVVRKLTLQRTVYEDFIHHTNLSLRNKKHNQTIATAIIAQIGPGKHYIVNMLKSVGKTDFTCSSLTLLFKRYVV